MHKSIENKRSFGRLISKRLKSIFKKNPDVFFRKVRGVIHVGANTGQEMSLYEKYGLSVIWIEPIDEVFEKLKSNLNKVTNQMALQALVTDVNDKEYDFNVANNNGASSSILEFDLHQDIWPEVTYEKKVKKISKTLPTLLKENNVNIADYDMLIMDTQGSELLVLEGAVTILSNFKYIKTEAPDFESYKGCCQLKDLDSFLSQYNYQECFRNKFATHPNGGSYFDVIYKRVN
jgi:FkbM family methyltransferase